MKRLPFVLIGALWLATPIDRESQAPTLAIIHATVIDATGASAKPDSTVLVEASRIARVGPSAIVSVPDRADTLDATGKFLIPGLRDMHVHLGESDEARTTLQRLLAAGITGVRDMASPVEEIIRTRNEVRTGEFIGPQLLVAGPILQAPLPFRLPPLVQTVAGPADARRLVSDLKARGVDFIKIGDTLSRDAYFAIAAQSRLLGIPFAGHLPASVSALEATRAGQRSIEHFGSAHFHGVLLGCSTQEAELARIVQHALDVAKGGGPAPDTILFRAEFTNRILTTYSDRKAAALFAAFARNGTWQVPTLAAIRSVWDDQRGTLAPEDLRAVDGLWQKYSEIIREMKRAGVRVLAGSDRPFTRADAPLHDELVALVNAGMSGMEALQSATLNPARFLGRSRSEGTIDVGKRADLVLLDADPLSDIANTRRVSAVILEGRLVTKRAH